MHAGAVGHPGAAGDDSVGVGGGADEAAAGEVGADHVVGGGPGGPRQFAGVAVHHVEHGVFVAQADQVLAAGAEQHRHPGEVGVVVVGGMGLEAPGRLAGVDVHREQGFGVGAPTVGGGGAVGAAGEHQSALEIDRGRAPDAPAAPVVAAFEVEVPELFAGGEADGHHAGGEGSVVGVEGGDHPVFHHDGGGLELGGPAGLAASVGPDHGAVGGVEGVDGTPGVEHHRGGAVDDGVGSRRGDLAGVDVVVVLRVVVPELGAVGGIEGVEASGPVAYVERAVHHHRSGGDHVAGVEVPDAAQAGGGVGVDAAVAGVGKGAVDAVAPHRPVTGGIGEAGVGLVSGGRRWRWGGSPGWRGCRGGCWRRGGGLVGVAPAGGRDEGEREAEGG